MAISASSQDNGNPGCPRTAMGIFGGTFDPVHYGHLQIALELKQLLGLAEMRLVPCAIPPHREVPGITAEHRLAMLELAIGQQPEMAAELIVDPCELKREGPSYTIDTLDLLRREKGESAPLCLCMGMDSFAGLTSWYRWDELLDYAHIVVAARPGWQPPASGALARLIADRKVRRPSSLTESAAGGVLLLETSLLPISATDIRYKLAHGLSVHSLLPDAVIDYIHRHGLYRQEHACQKH